VYYFLISISIFYFPKQQNNKTTKQQNNNTTKQQYNKQCLDIIVNLKNTNYYMLEHFYLVGVLNLIIFIEYLFVNKF